MFLEQTIGYLENEHESFLTVQYILFGSLAYMIVGSLLEGWLFYLYNEKYHPFKKILETDDGIELQDMSELQPLYNNPITSTRQNCANKNSSDACCYNLISHWRKWNNLKNMVHMTNDRPKPKKGQFWMKWRASYKRNSRRWKNICTITSGVIFLMTLIVSIIVVGSGITIQSSKFHLFLFKYLHVQL